MMSISSTFQARLNDLINEAVIERHIKKSELPKLLGIDYSSFSNALEYGILPTPRVAVKMADYFGCSLGYLLGNSDDEYFVSAKTPSSFAERIVQLCAERQVSFATVSRECSFYRGYLARWVKQQYTPSWEYLELLADYFHVSLDYLLGRTDETN